MFDTQIAGRHMGATAVVFGTGPSLNLYDGRFNKNSILIGSNEIIYYRHCVMDYYFIGDGGNALRGFYSNPLAYCGYSANISKFIRLPPTNRCSHYKTLPLNLSDFQYYKVDFETSMEDEPFSLCPDALVDAGSITFDILQFCLIAGFKKIYLVGHDCDYSNGSFFSEVDLATQEWSNVILKNWINFKNYQLKIHPSVKIFIVNPVKMNYFESVIN